MVARIARHPLTLFVAVVGVVASFLAGAAALAARVSPADPSTATSETLSPPANSDGWCVPTNGTTSLSLSSTMPPRITAVMAAKVRLVEVRFIAGTTSTRLCTKLGGALPAASCDALDADAQGILLDGNARSFAVARDFQVGGLPVIDAQANAGSDGAACVSVWW